MQRIAVPPLELRLQDRYLKLVRSHMHSVSKLVAGISGLPDANMAFAAVQAAWRLLNNERISLTALVEPLREAGLERLRAAPDAGFVLLVHDWSKLAFS